MLARTQQQDGWTLGFESSDDEPRVRDLDLATRLGFEHPRRIRSLIERLECAPEFGLCTTVVQSRGGRPGKERWLTEAQALMVIARSDTPKATSILREVIDVYLAYRRGQLVPAPLTLDATVANSARIKDDPVASDSLRLAARRLCNARHYSIQQVYGYIRKTQCVSSPFAVALPLLPAVVKSLEHFERGHGSLLSPREVRALAALAAREPQLPLFKGGH